MLALASLDCILTIDHGGNWLSYMSTKGYLQHIVQSLVIDDQQLQMMLQPNPEPLRALYILESKIVSLSMSNNVQSCLCSFEEKFVNKSIALHFPKGLLTRVAESATGAHTLLQCQLMTSLAECSVFDLRPEVDRWV